MTNDAVDDRHPAVLTERTRTQRDPGQRLVAIPVVAWVRRVEYGFRRRHGAAEVSAAIQFLASVTMCQRLHRIGLQIERMQYYNAGSAPNHFRAKWAAKRLLELTGLSRGSNGSRSSLIICLRTPL